MVTRRAAEVGRSAAVGPSRRPPRDAVLLESRGRITVCTLFGVLYGFDIEKYTETLLRHALHIIEEEHIFLNWEPNVFRPKPIRVKRIEPCV